MPAYGHNSMPAYGHNIKSWQTTMVADLLGIDYPIIQVCIFLLTGKRIVRAAWQLRRTLSAELLRTT
jgi:hypothetical protein